MSNLGPGTGTNFDSLGSWLAAVYKDSKNRLHGFYHAEPSANITNGNYFFRNASIGYAYSDDGGKTWTKPNYPKNEVISSKEYPIEGEPSLVVQGNFLYLYFGAIVDAKTGPINAGVARIRIGQIQNPAA